MIRAGTTDQEIAVAARNIEHGRTIEALFGDSLRINAKGLPPGDDFVPGPAIVIGSILIAIATTTGSQ